MSNKKQENSYFCQTCLSRMSNPATCEEDESLNLQVMSIVNDHDQEHYISLLDVKQALLEVPISILLGDLILDGWPDSSWKLKPLLEDKLMDGVFC